MLKAITIENFKSFGKKQSLPLAPLTLMIGANASGKSNAIEAFRFLSFLAEGQKLSALQHNIDDSNRIFRGSSLDLGYNGAEKFTLGCEIDHNVWDTFLVTLERSKSDLHITYEKIFSSKYKFPLCVAHEVKEGDLGKNRLLLMYLEHETIVLPLDEVLSNENENKIEKYIQKNIQQIIKPNHVEYCKKFDHNDLISDQISMVSYLENLIHPEVLYTISAWLWSKKIGVYLHSLLSHSFFIDPVPSKMRGDSAPEKILRNDCSNLAGVLQVLCEDLGKKALLLQFIKSLPEQNFTDIKFYDDRRGRYFFKLIETFGGEERPCLGELLSDGTLRVLAVAAALLSAPEGSTVVIEEIDNGIHPSRAHDLMALMLERAKQRNIRLLLTTHNPALMDALPDESLGDVVFSYRDPKDGDSRLIRLSDLDDYESLVFQGPLGDLVTRGVVDRFVKNPVSEEERKKKALEWLEQMEETEE